MIAPQSVMEGPKKIVQDAIHLAGVGLACSSRSHRQSPRWPYWTVVTNNLVFFETVAPHPSFVDSLDPFLDASAVFSLLFTIGGNNHNPCVGHTPGSTNGQEPSCSHSVFCSSVVSNCSVSWLTSIVPVVTSNDSYHPAKPTTAWRSSTSDSDNLAASGF